MLNRSRERIGDLDCSTITSPSEQFPKLAVILCHGYGAPAEDLVPLAAEVLSRVTVPIDQVAFVFPGAPISLADFGLYDGRAWWPLDLERILELNDADKISALRDNEPDQMPAALEKLRATVLAIKTRFNLKMEDLLLGGFSQGSMVTTQLAMSFDEPPAGLCIMSGTLLNESRLDELLENQSPFPVIQSHGTIDPILPFAGAELLRDKLSDAKFPVNFLPFVGGHAIPGEVIQALASMIDRIVESKSN